MVFNDFFCLSIFFCGCLHEIHFPDSVSEASYLHLSCHVSSVPVLSSANAFLPDLPGSVPDFYSLHHHMTASVLFLFSVHVPHVLPDRWLSSLLPPYPRQTFYRFCIDDLRLLTFIDLLHSLLRRCHGDLRYCFYIVIIFIVFKLQTFTSCIIYREQE